MVPESKLVRTERGLVPTGEGWFVLNAREAQWWERAVAAFPDYAEYQKKTDRVIPVFLVERR